MLQSQIGIFCNRHIDTILLCCIYAAGRRLDKDNTSMNNICIVYKRMYKENLNVINSVPLNKEIIGDIIKFYNLVFLNKDVKEFVLRLSHPKYRMNTKSTTEIANDILSLSNNFKYILLHS